MKLKLVVVLVDARSWLRNCSTSRMVADTIPDGAIVFFIDVILPATLWSTQPLAEMGTRSISLG